jgi:hypothetical protein
MPGVPYMQSDRRSTFTLSEDDSPLIQDFTPGGGLLGRVLRLLLRVTLRVIRVCAWLALLGLLHSVPLWLGIVVGYYLLLRLLSALRGGTRCSLVPMLLALLRVCFSLVSRGAILTYLLLRRFTLKPPWSFLVVGSFGVASLYGWTILLLEWGH